MRRLPSLNALRALEAAARHSSFKAAADELCVTPTAVSHQIRQIESLVGQSLFKRWPRPVKLTPAGQTLFIALQEGFDCIEAGVASVRDPKSMGPVVITATPAFASRWLIARLSALSQACGNQRFAVQASEQLVDLDAGEADLAIRYAREPDSRLVCRALVSDRYVPVAHPDLLAQGPELTEPFDLLHYPLIHFEWKRPGPAAPTWARWFDRARHGDAITTKLDLNQGLRLSEETHAIEAAIEGHGVALVSDFMVARELKYGLLQRASSRSLEGLTFFTAYSRRASRKKLLETAVNCLCQAMDNPA